MTDTTKIILGILAAIILIGGVWYAQNKESISEKKQMKIGVLAALTGKSANYGEMMRSGTELAAFEINQKAGYEKVKLIVEDQASNNNVALSVYQKIKSEIQIFMTGTSGVVLTLSPVANNDKIVLFNASAQSPAIRKAGDYVFSNINDSTVEVGDLAEVVKKDGLINVAIFYENDESGSGAKKVFKEKFKELGGKIAAEETFTGKAVDVRTQLEKIKKTNPEGIYVPAFPENAGLIMKQAEQMGIKAKWYSWNMEGTDIIKFAGKAAEGLTFPTTAFDPESKDGNIKKFVAAYQLKYNKTPTIYTATAYDGIYTIVQAIEATDGKSDSLKNYFNNMPAYNGVSGITKFDAEGSVKKALIFKTIKNGKFVPYEK